MVELKAENAQVKAENAQVKAENAQMKARLPLVVDCTGRIAGSYSTINAAVHAAQPGAQLWCMQVCIVRLCALRRR